MKRALVCAALLLVCSSALAEGPSGYERMVLSVAPSTALCAWFSKYDTRLHVFNDGDDALAQICVARNCARVGKRAAATISGPVTSNPLPAFIYVPREVADRVHLTLMVESTNYGLADRAFTEIPIIRESEFRHRVQLLGVRVDEGFRVTVRVYGLEVPKDTLSVIRIFDMNTNDLLYEEIYGFQSFPNAPDVSMECDITNYGYKIKHRDLRIEVESSREDARIYAFVSTTDNATQRFTTITPK